MRRGTIVAIGVAVGSAQSYAARAPDHLAEEPELVVQGSVAARVQRPVRWRAPGPRSQRAWLQFQAAHGSGWRAYWDADTGVPGRIYGSGISAPGSMADGAVAEAFARRQLADQVALLAPGVAATDLELVANVVSGGVRTVAFRQYFRGVPVLTGQVSFRFRNDRLVVIASEALPDISLVDRDQRLIAGQESVVAPDLVRAQAERWLTLLTAIPVSVQSVDLDPVILPIVQVDGVLLYRLVVRARVVGIGAPADWDVYLDATSGTPVARAQRLRYSSAAVRYDAPVRWWGAERASYPAQRVSVAIGGSTFVSSDDGQLAWSGDSENVLATLQVSGPLGRVHNVAGELAAASFPVNPGDTLVWSAAGDEFVDAQLSAYVHALLAKQWARTVTGGKLAWLDEQLPIKVNYYATCNAFSDGDTINFFQAGDGCGNTARMADVVYHEFGHSLHSHCIIPGAGAFDGALSEGISDFVAATITGDPYMGRGFYLDEGGLRNLDASRDAVWPDDISEIHTTGMIIGGALWDMRKNLIGSLGEAEGATYGDAIFYQALRRSSDIPSMYVELLLADDDDGNLVNGTPNECAIGEAFARHGLGDPLGPGSHGVTSLERQGWRVAATLRESETCEAVRVQLAELDWQSRDRAESGTVMMVADELQGLLQAQIPAQQGGSVVRYRVRVTLANGEQVGLPANAADPWYEFFVGETVPLYCTDFEGATPPAGWRHELLEGTEHDGADDWQWGTPLGREGSSDPAAAYSGVGAYGNDLGQQRWNGRYQPNKKNSLSSPRVAVQGFDNVRLQYRRWLTVEDGYYDQAQIVANDQVVWSNLFTREGGATYHRDREWVFHDVDLSDTVRDEFVRVRFTLSSDGGVELGGWTIDDLCIVGYREPECGNGTVEGGEQCDDGNLEDGDECSSSCVATPATACQAGSDQCDPGQLPEHGVGALGCGCRAGGAASRRPSSWLLAVVALWCALWPLPPLRRRRN